MDYSAAAVKSDRLIPDDLRHALTAAVAPLEDVPDDRKDWHPGSGGKVLDLVHPSLWPLRYGRSRILSDKRIGLHDALEHSGLGVIIPSPHPFELNWDSWDTWDGIRVPSLSRRFQWLPCDVVVREDGTVKIDSYINNLHPQEHAGLYSVIEQFVEKSLPAWDLIYRWPNEFRSQRITTKNVRPHCAAKAACASYYICVPYSRPLNEGEAPREDSEPDDDRYGETERGILDYRWFRETHKIRLPDIHDPHDTPYIKVDASCVNSSGFFNGAQRLQVIVKLSNIHLTPDNPRYEGGSWHIEGQLNEHICATALFYYESENITDCELAFRTSANSEELWRNINYQQNDEYFLPRTFAIDWNQGTQQEVGSVLTRPGRALFFPNVYQHRVSPFSLADPKKSGHRKILALFLVDPAIPIISTANVPPQQEDWWSRVTGLSVADLIGVLPAELQNMVVENIDFPISEVEAKEMRDELIKERKVMQGATGNVMKNMNWGFCEH